MAHEWKALQELGHEEMKVLKIGTRVKLNHMHKPEGVIADARSPVGILAPRYKCKWDDGDESGWLSASSLTALPLETNYIGRWTIKTGPQCWEILALHGKANSETELETFQNDDPGGTYFAGPVSELPAGNSKPQVGDFYYPNGYNVDEPPCWIKAS